MNVGRTGFDTGDGAAGLRIAHEISPPLALVTANLQLLFEMVRQMIDGTRLSSLLERLVFMSGGAFNTAVEDFLGNLPNPRLEKPFPVHELRTVVRRYGL